MIQQVRNLFLHRQLLNVLVSRELKARYRSSSIGFLWSALNPLIMMLVYTVVFQFFMRYPWNEAGPYHVFLFCGLIPWQWFSASLIEGSLALVSGGGMLKSIKFPSELLPITVVLSNGVHGIFGLLILFGFMLASRLTFGAALIWLPIVVLIQMILTLGLGIGVACLTIFFRDLQQLLQNFLMLCFFATPILYKVQLLDTAPPLVQLLFWLNPMTHIIMSYQEILFYNVRPNLFNLGITGAFSILCIVGGLYIFDKLRDSLVEGV